MGRNSFGKNTVKKVFRKSSEIIGRDSSIWRMDRYGKLIHRAAYGDRNSEFGWDIHHRDGNHLNNDLSNLEATHFESHKNIHNK